MTKIDKNVCRKEQGAAEPGNTCLETPGRCESCPNWWKKTAVLKTLPSRFARGDIERFLGLDGKPCWTLYLFTLGRGRPSRTKYCGEIEFGGVRNAYIGVDQLWFTHRGQIIGHFRVMAIVQNVGQLPKLTTMDGEPSQWQIKADRWVAICNPPFQRLEKKIFHEAFRGWRYFDLDSYRKTPGAKLHI